MRRQDCVSCGASNSMQHFEKRDVEIDFKALKKTVSGLCGWECTECGEIELAPESAQRYSDASDQLILEHRHQVATEMRRIRRKLHFTQRTAVELLSGGGHNAFSRYERAEVEPPKPLFVLMHLLDRYPELIEDIKAINADNSPAQRTPGARASI
ncbi:type II toxin-antitoxin system MqsA family antitoxin [Pseudomonas fuscovaginae UPB0736]|uniref:HTH-type transcriptional regulator / antitoxin MqsA n=1 Tax=Pseudomonas asplenii TaxID=53407 RepID=A0A1H6MUD1_9PSED|nr:type II toxin-antitoxin system MqsA family antitoxin [Pseudomonas fuscovaginae]UUQ63314.1 type II toxin-antitoxin system MqsA family antitoxin [Pseudomonas fuscovaginae UPB0736]SEI05604.1 HTH-type transcriptional regulator / antitoxin MqsA [Pseudomonas fuscovaginae]